MTNKTRNKTRNKTLATAAALFGLLMSACSAPDNDYSAFSTVDPDGWEYGHTYVYRPEISDSIARGTLCVMARHSNDYPYRNLWLEVSYQQLHPDSTITFRRDTVNFTLADLYGNWTGSGLGTSFQATDTVATDFMLISGAPIRVRHIMRQDRIPEIEQIGIIFEEK
ncbi:MAG: gliding motility lipoprotein GldH [Muribaculaceae bacterium]|nr:gliding motility lipoprotein GldH [Bacteroides sp.]MDE6033901.1 gliding motility lipoprotein GldH [Muribaculaceae bacterium]MBD5294637.1 gliding motility lipoprotein GldH [Bacteroides sp.]MBD5352137.1 gliding motility lipoprotein GldH [Bacteroides sp.]MBD5360974.1 gliding motility lipoprotein GldH [Bacteroides sp.]